MSRVLLLGASGLLGSALSRSLASDHEVIRQSRTAGACVDAVADPGDPLQVRALVSRTRPDVVINAIALTSVDLCQRDPQAAFATNARVVEHVASAIAGSPAYLIQVSTDHFYTRPFPQAEQDVDVLNMYAATKLLGELFALRHANSTVLRTNFAGRSSSPSRHSFSDWIVDALRAGSTIRLARDLVFNPLSMESLVLAIERLVRQPAPGTYNLGSAGSISKYDAGIAIARHLGLETALIECVLAEELGFTTPRPTDMTMDVSRFEHDCFPLPSTSSEIEKIARSHE